MPFEKLHNKHFWGAMTIVLIILTFKTNDPFYLELVQIGLAVSVVALIMKAFKIQSWRGGGCFEGKHIQ